jgi:hypothetical protein
MLDKNQCKEIYKLDVDQIQLCKIIHSQNEPNNLEIYTSLTGKPIVFSEAKLGLENFHELYTSLFTLIPQRFSRF